MPSPVAHSLIGLAVGRTLSPARVEPATGWFLFVLFSAVAPDLDFLAGALFAGVNDLHRGPSHTLFAAVIYGLVAALVLRSVGWRMWHTFFVGTAVYASHVLLDACTGDGRAGAGVRMLWPFSEEVIAGPWMIFRGIRHGGDGDTLGVFLRELASRHNVVQLQYELLIGMPFLIAAYYFANCPFRGTLAASSTPQPQTVSPATSEV